MYPRTIILFMLLTTMQTTGCYSTWDINPMSLHHLRDFHKGEERELIARGGERVPFSSDTALDLGMRDGSHVEDFRLRSASVEDGLLIATEDGSGRVRRLSIEIPNVDYVIAKGPDGKKTAGHIAATTAAVLGVGALTALVILGLYSAVPVH